MVLFAKVAYNTIIQFVSKFLSSVLGFLTIALIARYLGANGFGEYTTAITFISFFAILADFGLTLVTSQMISEPGANEQKILNNLFALRFVSAVFFLSLAPIFVFFFPYSSEVKISVLIVSFSFLFIALNQILIGMFQKHLRMDKDAIAEVLGRLFLFFGVFVSIKFDFSLYGIMFITSIASFLNFIFHYFFARSLIKIKFSFDWQYWQEIFKRALPMAITIALNLLYLKTDTLLLSIIQRPSKMGIMTEVGLYGAAYKVVDVLVSVPFMFSGIVLPILSSVWFSGKKEKFFDVMQKSFDFLVILAIPMLVGTQFLAKDIMLMLGGGEFLSSGVILQILIVAAFFIFLGNIFSHTIVAIKKQKQIIWAYLFTAISSILGYLIFIPCLSYYGAAWVTVYSEFIIALFSAWYVWRYTAFLPSFRVFAKAFLASFFMVLFFVLSKYFKIYNFWFLSIGASLIYFFFLYLFGGIKKEHILKLKQ